MPKFYWTGVDMFAHTHSGYMYAATEQELDSKLLNRDIALISSKKMRNYKRTSFSDAQRAQIYAYFARLLHAGILVPDALQSIAEGIDNVKVYDMMRDIASHIQHGASVADAMGKYPIIAPQKIIHVLAAGEQSGKLAYSLESIARYFGQTDTIKKKIRTSLFMPGMTLAAFVGVIIFVVTLVVPRFADLLQSFDQELPAVTQWILYVSECCTGLFGMYAMAFIGTGVIVWRKMRTIQSFKRVRDYSYMYLPMIGPLFQLSLYAHMFQSLSLLLANGVMLPRALALIRKTIHNHYALEQLHAVEDAVRAGKPLSSAVQQNIPLCSGYAATSVLQVGESSGNVSRSCVHIADELFAQLHVRLSRLTALIQPLCIVILGIGIAFLMIALYAPMMNISFHI